MNFFNKIFNKKENYEEKLLKQYGYANKLKKYNLKILFIADTHNCLSADSEVLEYIKKQKDYDYCILLGDHSGNDLNEILKVIPKEKLCGILGNHDDWNLYEKYGINNISGKVILINGVKIAGLSGSYKYKDSKEYALYTHEESINIADNMEQADIFVSHDKPFLEENHNPAHDGLKGVTKYIYKNNISLHIHGHLHQEYEETLKNGTKSICLYMAKVVEI